MSSLSISNWLERRRTAQTQRAVSALRTAVDDAYDRVADAVRFHQFNFVAHVAEEKCLTALRQTLQQHGQTGLAYAAIEMQEQFYRDVKTRADLEVMRIGLGSRFEPSEAEKQRRQNHGILVANIVEAWIQDTFGTVPHGPAAGRVAVHALLNAAPSRSPNSPQFTLEAVADILEKPTAPDAEALHTWQVWAIEGLGFHERFGQWRQEPEAWVRHAAVLGSDTRDTLARAGLLTDEGRRLERQSIA